MAKRPPAPRSSVPTPPKPPEEPDFAKEIERRIAPLVPSGARGQIVSMVMTMMSEQFSGPIAHPRHLREYEDILPGSAERIIAMAERAQEHNIKMGERVVTAQISDQKRGMRYGIVALIADLAAAVVMGLNGNNVIAGAILGVGVAGVVVAFIKGRFSE